MFKRMQLKMALAFMLLMTLMLLTFSAGTYLLMQTYNNRQLANEIQTMLLSISESEWLTEGYEETPEVEGVDEEDAPEGTRKTPVSTSESLDDDPQDENENTEATSETSEIENTENTTDDEDNSGKNESDDDESEKDAEQEETESYLSGPSFTRSLELFSAYMPVFFAQTIAIPPSTGSEAQLSKIDLKIPKTLSIFNCYFIYDTTGALVHWKNDKAALFDEIARAARDLPISNNPRVVRIPSDEEVAYLMAKVPIVIKGAVAGSVSVGRDISAAEATMKNLSQIIWMSLAFGAIVSLVFGYLMAGKTVTPIRQAYLSKERFVADASHELRTPISVIMLSADALESSPDDESFRKQTVQDIKEETLKMSGLVENLLFLARSDASRVKMTTEHFSMTELIHRELSGFDKIAQSKDIQLRRDIPENLSLSGDKKLISSVITILVDNAIKYTPENGVVTVSCSREGSAAKARLVFVVADSGIGIPQTELKRIFDRFHRLDSSRSRSSGGYGLGLAIAKEIVLLHDGTIEVFSQENAGTTFVVRLPVRGS